MTMSKRALIVEDDANIAELLRLYLGKDGFEVMIAADGGKAESMFDLFSPDVVLLDIMLPVKDGWQVCRDIRKKSSVPIIMLTAKGETNDKVSGLEMGADDYVTKPFEVKELLARIQCVTRRSPVINQTELSTYCDISFDETSNTLTGPDGSCTCSKREGAMLEIFVKNGGQTLSRNTLLLKIWGPDSDVEDGNLDNYIYFVRRRLKAVGSRLKLRTIRGIGYCLLEE